MSTRRILFTTGTLLALTVCVYCLGQVFRGVWILPQAFSIGPLRIHYYGITMALAVGAAWWLALRRAPQYGMTAQHTDSLLQWLVLGGFVGARLYHVASSWHHYAQYPLEILQVWHGGLSIFGALFGGFIVLVIFVFRKHFLIGSSSHITPNPSYLRRGTGPVFPFHFPLSTFHFLDWLVPSVVLGQIIGRFGNLFNYEAFGYPTDLSWKMFVPEQFRPDELAQNAFFHPLFLYEAVGNLVILYLLLYIDDKNKSCHCEESATKQSQVATSRVIDCHVAKPPRNDRGTKEGAGVGRLFFLYLFLYNALRFIIEFWRVDSTFLWEFIRLNTISSGIACLIGIIGLVLGSIQAHRNR